MSKIDVEKSSKLENRDFYPATAACKMQESRRSELSITGKNLLVPLVIF